MWKLNQHLSSPGQICRLGKQENNGKLCDNWVKHGLEIISGRRCGGLWFQPNRNIEYFWHLAWSLERLQRKKTVKECGITRNRAKIGQKRMKIGLNAASGQNRSRSVSAMCTSYSELVTLSNRSVSVTKHCYTPSTSQTWTKQGEERIIKLN